MKIPLLIIASLLLVSCSAEIVKESPSGKSSQNQEDKTRKAMEYFLNGQTFDAQERFEDAAGEYNKALEIEKSGGIYYSVALDYLKLNKLAWAKQAAQKAVELDKSNKEYVFLLANIFEAGKSPDSAAVCYERILKDDSLDVRANYNLAEIYKTTRPSQALSILNRIIRAMGPTPEVLFEIATINERLGNNQETIKTIEDLLKINPSDALLKKVLIESYIRVKDYDKAMALIDDQLKTYPDDFGLQNFKGSIYAEKSDWPNAKKVYSKVAKNPDVDFKAKIKIGMAFLAQAQKDSLAADVAMGIFETVDKDTADWQVKFYLAEMNLVQKNDSLAVKYYKEASQLAEWNVDVWTRYGGLLFDKGKYADLITEMEKGIKTFPDNFGINLLYGLALAQTNKHKDAKVYLQKAVNINSRDVMALTALGYSLNQLKEDEEAIKVLNQALAVDPDNIQALSMAGLIYETKKDYEKSDGMYKRALAVDSTDAQILNNYAYSLSERGIDLDKALNMAKIAVAKDQKNSSYLDTIGWIYYKLGDYKKALSYIIDALGNGEKSAAIYEHLGDVYLKLKKRDNALLNWRKALEIEPGNEKIKEKIEKELK